MSDAAKVVKVRGDYITLGQFLKLIGEVGAGSDVRFYLQQEDLRVNGDEEERRGRKLRHGDLVRTAGGEYLVETEAGA